MILGQTAPGAGNVVNSLLREGMEFYDLAVQLQPLLNDDGIPGWKTCARMIMDSDSVSPDDQVAAATRSRVKQ